MAATKLLAMEARQEAELPRGPGWQYEPKWDGFRCLAIRDGGPINDRRTALSSSCSRKRRHLACS